MRITELQIKEYAEAVKNIYVYINFKVTTLLYCKFLYTLSQLYNEHTRSASEIHYEYHSNSFFYN